MLEQALAHEIDQSLKAVVADDSVLTRFNRFLLSYQCSTLKN